ncbi:MAG: hypothetical protein R3C02_15010 [Planctomycetaceae bacterium]
MIRQHSHSRHSDLRRGYSLIELIIAVGASAVLMGGMASALLISNHALDVPESQSGHQLDASDAQQDLLSDLQHAVSFSERTEHAVTFQVPDRDGDGDLEKVRYAWSGTGGQPLTYEYNDSSPITLVEDVYQFDLSFLTQTITAPEVIEDEGLSSGTLLFVSGGLVVEPSFLDKLAGETSYVDIAETEEGYVSLFESWGYDIERISPDQEDAVIQKALESADVVYVSAETISAGNALLFGTTLGVVNAQMGYTDDFGFSSAVAVETGTQLKISAAHYITSDFSTGQNAKVLQSNGSIYRLSETMTSDLTDLALFGSESSFVAMEAGIEDFNGRTVAGRRVQIPWVTPLQSPSALTADGQLLLQRALEWAAGADLAVGGSGSESLDFTTTSAKTTTTTTTTQPSSGKGSGK